MDHPSFGVPLLGRWLVGHGYRVGIVAQPRWKDEGQGIADLARMGRPRLFTGVSAGALDSMLAHYTAFRKKRHDDAYTPGGEAGSRPNRAVIVYAGLIRKAFPGLPLLAGGIEASLRRITHYDFWADSLRRSILFDARLDILSCGMGERALLDVARRLDAVAELVGDLSVLEPVDGELWPDLWAGIPGTARLVKTASIPSGAEELDGLELVRLPSHDEMLAVPRAYLDGTVRLERETHQSRRILAQPNGDRTVLLMPPAAPLTTEELDGLYALPFSRRPHPSYKEPIPAVEMIATSITIFMITDRQRPAFLPPSSGIGWIRLLAGDVFVLTSAKLVHRGIGGTSSPSSSSRARSSPCSSLRYSSPTGVRNTRSSSAFLYMTRTDCISA